MDRLVAFSLPNASLALLATISGEHELLPTELFPLRADVDRANSARMALLAGPVQRFATRDSDQAPSDKRRRLLESMTAVMTLSLKRDAQVMLVKNVSGTFVNRTVGRVVGFFSDSDHAAAAVMNRAGGGGWYGGQKEDELLPLVGFRTFKGSEKVLVSRDEFRHEDADGRLLAKRVPLPSVLAWAMSNHKAQGQTIQKNQDWPLQGQSYVALSRAASLEGLQIIGFDARKVVVPSRVVEWSKPQGRGELVFKIVAQLLETAK
ncbi:hypothetical protein BD289DRAFT_457754 [Coniella lustricola]|uniref:ATP-dependent DNA helicase n=1 Tax=Coniella lustricola TaxID=2025994 RepID=A0A2T3AMH9_9PEZI|nr:hypothetical protein BD289DRAFT_457754 [Coniella lustricola]